MLVSVSAAEERDPLGLSRNCADKHWVSRARVTTGLGPCCDRAAQGQEAQLTGE